MDAKGLELRMLAHYMKDDRFTEEVVSGDPHTFNQKAAGLATRNQAKTFIYAFLYGAGPAKIGSIVNGTAKDGRELQQQFLSNLPNLARLVNAVQNKARRGYVRGLDGRRIWVRSNHAALNTLLQGGGAIVCKQWAIFLKKVIDKRNLDAILVNTIHDEQQYEASRMDADELCVIADETMQETGRFFDMNLVLNADSKIGNTWAETH
jgi:DNA polymerase I-like protein with 3'-5' exonuclease and polymerase domains